MPRLLIWGAAGHGRVVADIVRLGGEYEIEGFVDDLKPDRAGQDYLGVPVLGGRECLRRQRHAGIRHALVAIGDCSARLRIGTVLRDYGFELAKAVHPSAVIARDATIGGGAVVCAAAVVGSGARVGELVIINTAATIDHDCRIGDGAHVGPGAHLGGHVEVGEGAWVGLGASVRDHASIGAGATVGMGSVVTRDVRPYVVSFGVPARVRGGGSG